MDLQNTRSNIRMSLNLPALERLIGGDSNIEVELRHQVAKELVKKHLSQLIKNEFLTKYDSGMREVFDQEIKDTIGTKISERYQTWGAYIDRWNIVPELKTKIEECLSQQLLQSIEKFKINIEEKLSSIIKEKADYLEKRYQDYIDMSVKEACRGVLEKKINDEISRRLKIVAERKDL